MSFSIYSIIFLLLLYASLSLSKEVHYNAYHLCAKVMSGNFESLRFQSVYTYRDKYIVFVEASHKYYVYQEDISPSSVVIKPDGDDSFQPWEAHNFVHAKPRITSLEDLSNIKGLYTFTQGGEKSSGYKSEYLLFVGGSKEYWINLAPSWAERHNPYYAQIEDSTGACSFPYSIIHDGHYSGYVIQQDFYTPADELAIYDLEVPDRYALGLHWWEHHSEEAKRTAIYYYMEKTEHPNQVHFVLPYYRGVPDPRKRLFTRLPVGYMWRGSMFLLDSALGCVLVIENMNERLRSREKGSFSRTRINIPFEDFFKCDRQIYSQNQQLDKNRCQTTSKDKPIIINNGDTLTVNEQVSNKDEMNPQVAQQSNNNSHNTKLTIWRILFAFAVILVLLLIVGLVIVIRKKRTLKSQAKAKSQVTKSNMTKSKVPNLKVLKPNAPTPKAPKSKNPSSIQMHSNQKSSNKSSSSAGDSKTTTNSNISKSIKK